MFTIVISEKGGAERRETFERNEVSVGRVQGNDLMLPKGNVSKHHARLLFRDARFIVTDLKSTNGTYVNGRKIIQATMVREGDKIYIGDFVLRVSTGQVLALPQGVADSPRIEPTGNAPRPRLPSGQEGPAAVSPLTPAAPSSPPTNGPSSLMLAPAAAVSHYPLERDPDSESAPELGAGAAPKVPGPPRLPHGADIRQRSTTSALRGDHGGFSPPSEISPLSLPTRGAMAGPDRAPPRETPQQASRRLALITLLDRVADAIDLSPIGASVDVADDWLERLERVALEQSNAMKAEGEAPPGMDPDRLAREAVRELVGLGPLGPLLDDEEITEIHVARTDYVLVMRGSAPPTLADPSFSGEDALSRVVARLAKQIGQPIAKGQTLVEGQLASGTRLLAVGPPVSSGWVLTLRKRVRIESSLDQLVRVGALSRPMATFLETCVAGRANLLVVGADSVVVGTVIGALASVSGVGDGVTLFQDGDEIAIANGQLTIIDLSQADADRERVLRTAARLSRNRLVIASLRGTTAVATLDAIAEGSDGVVAGLFAPSLRQGLARLAGNVAMARPGILVDVAREAIAESFDIAIEARRAPDGKVRILRIADPFAGDAKVPGARDIFVASGEGGGDAAFSVTGTIPRFAHELASRGIRVDPALFRKPNRGVS